MYERCLRRRDNAVDDTRCMLYEERLGVIREVMQTCKSGDPSVRFAASQMMSDISEDENVNLQLCNTMDDAE